MALYFGIGEEASPDLKFYKGADGYLNSAALNYTKKLRKGVDSYL